MSTVLRLGGHRFYFYANERNEPPHVHIQAAGKSAKFWLSPVALARSAGYDARDLRVLRGYVEQHRTLLENTVGEHCWRTLLENTVGERVA